MKYFLLFYIISSAFVLLVWLLINDIEKIYNYNSGGGLLAITLVTYLVASGYIVNISSLKSNKPYVFVYLLYIIGTFVITFIIVGLSTIIFTMKYATKIGG